MPEKLKELLDNKWFWIFILLMFAAVLAGRVTRCARNGGKTTYTNTTRNHWSKLLLVMDHIEGNYVDSMLRAIAHRRGLSTLLRFTRRVCYVANG